VLAFAAVTSLRALLFPFIVGGWLLLAARPASAQLHWDAGLDAGGSARLRTSGTDKTGFGGLVGLKAHWALLPLVRVGAYVDQEVSSTGEPSARRYTSFGGRIKLTPPLGSDAYRAWIFLGFGYAAVYSSSFESVDQGVDPSGRPITTKTSAFGAGGGFFEIPVGIGGAVRLRKPWELTAELSGRFGLGTTGSLYASEGRPGLGPDATGTGYGPTSFAAVGNDSFALLLTVGIGVDL
jgi:hypothetical protein